MRPSCVSPGASCSVLQGWVVKDRLCCRMLIIETDKWEKRRGEDTLLGEKRIRMSSLDTFLPPKSRLILVRNRKDLGKEIGFKSLALVKQLN